MTTADTTATARDAAWVAYVAARVATEADRAEAAAEAWAVYIAAHAARADARADASDRAAEAATPTKESEL